MDISVRSMIYDDINILSSEFAKQGWKGKTPELFTKYFNEQNLGIRHVVVALVDNCVAGYVTLLPNDIEGPFANKNIPTVCDFNVIIKYRRRGVGSALMDAVEALSKETSDIICLGVGLYSDYGTAQRMYAKRGYIPDGSGCWYRGVNLPPGHPCTNDDDLLLYMSKKL